jgi:hypothetical protein
MGGAGFNAAKNLRPIPGPPTSPSPKNSSKNFFPTKQSYAIDEEEAEGEGSTTSSKDDFRSRLGLPAPPTLQSTPKIKTTLNGPLLGPQGGRGDFPSKVLWKVRLS